MDKKYKILQMNISWKFSIQKVEEHINCTIELQYTHEQILTQKECPENKVIKHSEIINMVR